MSAATRVLCFPIGPALRMNDAGVDPRGSLWVGSMRNNVNADGSDGEAGGTDGILFRIDPGGKVTEVEDQIGISNTLAVESRSEEVLFWRHAGQYHLVV